MTLDPKDFKTIPDWLLGGYWPDMDYKDQDSNRLSTKEFGDNSFKGRTHPAIAYMAVTRFTEPGDLVYIPFAGSGTEIEVCRKYGRKTVAIDLNPFRTDLDIITADATRFVVGNPRPKLIIAHPPYEDIYKYSEDDNDLSKRGLDYEKLVRRCCRSFNASLEKKGKLVVIVGDVYHDGEEWPLDLIWYAQAKLNKFKLIGRIFRSFGETKVNSKNKNLRKYRLVKHDRFYLDTDFVLVFEKKMDV